MRLNMVFAIATKLEWHSGGMYRPSYYTTDKAEVDVRRRDAENGIRGKVGPFLMVGDICLTKKQAMNLAKAIAEEAEKMTGA